MPVPIKPIIGGIRWMAGVTAPYWTYEIGVTSYKISRGTVMGGPYTLLSTGTVTFSSGVFSGIVWNNGFVGVTVPIFNDPTVVNGTTYYYVVTATNASGDSPQSDEKAQTPLNLTSDSSFVSQSIPATMVVGCTYSLSISFTNTGQKDWSSNSAVQGGGLSAVDLSGTLNIALALGQSDLITTGQVGVYSHPFPAQFTAPSIPGSYPVSLRLEVDGCGLFGATAPTVNLQVVLPQENKLTRYPKAGVKY